MLADLIRGLLDDLGTYQTPWVEEQLRALISARHRAGLPMLVTTNLTLAQLRAASERIASRLIGMCGGLGGAIVEWAGPDRRELPPVTRQEVP